MGGSEAAGAQEPGGSMRPMDRALLRVPRRTSQSNLGHEETLSQRGDLIYNTPVPVEFCCQQL